MEEKRQDFNERHRARDRRVTQSQPVSTMLVIDVLYRVEQLKFREDETIG